MSSSFKKFSVVLRRLAYAGAAVGGGVAIWNYVVPDQVEWLTQS